MTDTPEPKAYPPGDYAIAELFGHTTIVGRISEVEKFGTKMLAIEPLFNDTLMDPIFQGGASIYRLSPCSVEVAFKEQPRKEWQLPAAVRVLVPLALLPPPEPERRGSWEDNEDEDDSDLDFDPNAGPAMNDDPGMA